MTLITCFCETVQLVSKPVRKTKQVNKTNQATNEDDISSAQFSGGESKQKSPQGAPPARTS